MATLREVSRVSVCDERIKNVWFFFPLNEMLESNSSLKANFKMIKQWAEKT